MNQTAFILIGRSGCGKGTQGSLLTDYLKKNDSKNSVLYIQNGSEFREFIKGESTTQKISNEYYKTDKLQPEFLSVYMWINVLVKNYKGNQHIIFDGAPRRKHEAGVLDSIFDFYGIKNIFVIHLNVSDKWATDHLMERHRMDDKKEDITKRLAWFQSDVVPAIEYYKSNPRYTFLDINGQRHIEDVHKDIISRLNI